MKGGKSDVPVRGRPLREPPHDVLWQPRQIVAHCRYGGMGDGGRGEGG